ncbi:MAG: hypothetical protein K2X39_08630, partial [Silvanigrellaceae bacterium]|nr:hypothetical protein [Silvanigrellaceae bacterium]
MNSFFTVKFFFLLLTSGSFLMPHIYGVGGSAGSAGSFFMPRPPDYALREASSILRGREEEQTAAAGERNVRPRLEQRPLDTQPAADHNVAGLDPSNETQARIFLITLQRNVDLNYFNAGLLENSLAILHSILHQGTQENKIRAAIVLFHLFSKNILSEEELSKITGASDSLSYFILLVKNYANTFKKTNNFEDAFINAVVFMIHNKGFPLFFLYDYLPLTHIDKVKVRIRNLEEQLNKSSFTQVQDATLLLEEGLSPEILDLIVSQYAFYQETPFSAKACDFSQLNSLCNRIIRSMRNKSPVIALSFKDDSPEKIISALKAALFKKPGENDSYQVSTTSVKIIISHTGSITDEVLKFIADHFINCTELHFYSNISKFDYTPVSSQLTDSGFEQLKKLPHLEKLVFESGFPQVSDIGIGYLSSLTNLNEIRLDGCNLTDESLRVFSKLPKLNKLYLNHSAHVDLNITDAGVRDLL